MSGIVAPSDNENVINTNKPIKNRAILSARAKCFWRISAISVITTRKVSHPRKASRLFFVNHPGMNNLVEVVTLHARSKFRRIKGEPKHPKLINHEQYETDS